MPNPEILKTRVGIVGGGSYWSHYLVGLVPGVVLVVAVTATRDRWTRQLGAMALAFTVTSTLLSTGLQAGTARTREARPDRTEVVGTWLRDAARPGDSGTVLRYDGTLWRRQATPTRRELRALWGRGPTEVYAAGDSGTMLRYDGAAWRSVTIPTQGFLYGLFALPAGEMVLVGEGGRILEGR